MKRNLIAVIAIVLAVGFSAFTSTDSKRDLVSYYYFQIADQGYLPSDPVQKAHATFIQFSEAIPNGSGCSEPNSEQCVSGFNSDQVQLKSGSSTEYELINNSQVPQTTPKRRP
jgi:hypothetical protein